jgi:hypothetical protein
LPAILGVKQSKIFIEESSKEVPSDLLALGRKQCRLITGLLIDHSTSGRYLHVTDLLDNSRNYCVFGPYPSSGILKN